MAKNGSRYESSFYVSTNSELFDTVEMVENKLRFFRRKQICKAPKKTTKYQNKWSYTGFKGADVNSHVIQRLFTGGQVTETGESGCRDIVTWASLKERLSLECCMNSKAHETGPMMTY